MKMIYSTRRKAFPKPRKSTFRKLLKRAVDLCRIQLTDEQVVSINFVGPRSIAEINEQYVGHQGITDVISFDYFNYDGDDLDGVAIEIFICLDKALLEGTQRDDSSYAEEVVLYLVHGLLHAAGEDDLNDLDRKHMRKREQDVMTELKKDFIFSDIFPAPAVESA